MNRRKFFDKISGAAAAVIVPFKWPAAKTGDAKKAATPGSISPSSGSKGGTYYELFIDGKDLSRYCTEMSVSEGTQRVATWDNQNYVVTRTGEWKIDICLLGECEIFFPYSICAPDKQHLIEVRSRGVSMIRTRALVLDFHTAVLPNLPVRTYISFVATGGPVMKRHRRM